MTETFHNHPLFLWQALFNFISLVLAGLLIGFVTTFYLKRKDEITRMAGVILEKRVYAQQEVYRYIGDSPQGQKGYNQLGMD